ncbi:TRAF-like family protein [Raphanus sativus]|nr:TRAF-like family protein [Raphanus sativus]
MDQIRRLILNVTGNKTDGGNNHISLYVRIEDTNPLPKGWEVKLISNSLSTIISNTNGTVKRYKDANKEWGFRQMIPLATFYNTNEGYIMQDTCSFGAGIFIVNPTHQQEKVTFMPNPPNTSEGVG